VRTSDDNCCASDDDRSTDNDSRTSGDDRSTSDNGCTDYIYHRCTFWTCRNCDNKWSCFYADNSQYLSRPISGFRRQRITRRHVAERSHWSRRNRRAILTDVFKRRFLYVLLLNSPVDDGHNHGQLGHIPQHLDVGAIPTVGTRKVVDMLVVMIRSRSYVHGTLISARHVAKTLVSEKRDPHRALMIQSPFSSTREEE